MFLKGNCFLSLLYIGKKFQDRNRNLIGQSSSMTVLSLMLLHDTKLQLKHISCFVISLFSINSLKFPTFYKEPNYLREFVNFQSQSHPLEFSLPSTPLFCSSSLSTLCTIQPLDLKDVCFLKKLYVYTTDLLTTHLGFPAFSTKVLLPFH